MKIFYVVLPFILAACSGGDFDLEPRPGPLGGSSTNTNQSTPFDLTKLSFEVGPAEIVLGPTQIVDSPFRVQKVDGGFRGYMGNAVTYLFEGSSVADLRLTSLTTPALLNGSGDAFDSTGAWLTATDNIGSMIKGWYHAEGGTGGHIKSIAYAESSDAGRSFGKINYPSNQVVTGMPVSGQLTSVGDHSIIQRDGYYYMYFSDQCFWKTSVARASIASGGLPGTWKKYFVQSQGDKTCDASYAGSSEVGAFTEAGLQGRYTPIGNLGTNATIFGPGNQIVLTGVDHWFGGLKMSFSKDAAGPNWNTLAEPLLRFTENDWTATRKGQVVAYPSIVSPDGEQFWGNQSIYLYYMYLFPGYNSSGTGDDFSQRYLIKREVRVHTNETSSNTQVLTALNSYHSVAHTDTWDTTGPVRGDFQSQGTLAYIANKGGENMMELTDCYIPLFDDHNLGYNGVCGSGDYNLRSIGYIWKNSKAIAHPVPLYRCFDQATLDHFISTRTDCDGRGNVDFLIGYGVDPKSL